MRTISGHVRWMGVAAAAVLLLSGCGGGEPDPAAGMPPEGAVSEHATPSGEVPDNRPDDASDPTSGGDSGNDSGDEEEPLEPRDAGVSLDLASAPFGDGSTVHSDGIHCQNLTWPDDVLPDGVRLTITGASFEVGGVEIVGGCGAAQCIGQTVASDGLTFCVLSLRVPDDVTSDFGGHITGTLWCPDEASCRQAQANSKASFTVDVVSPNGPTTSEDTETTDGTGDGEGNGTGEGTQGGEGTGDNGTGEGDATPGEGG